MSSKMFTLVFFAISTSGVLFDLSDPIPNLLALLFAGIFLFILVEQNKQVNVLPIFEVEVQVSIAAPLAFSAAWISNARFADTG